jgi:hypothetical protein
MRHDTQTIFTEVTLSDGRTFYHVNVIRQSMTAYIDRRWSKVLKAFGANALEGTVIATSVLTYYLQKTLIGG